MSFKERLVSRLNENKTSAVSRIALLGADQYTDPTTWKNDVFSHIRSEKDHFVHTWTDIGFESEATDSLVQDRFDVSEWGRNLARQRYRDDRLYDEFGYEHLEFAYSLMRAAYIKTRHEMKTNRKYDIVVFSKGPLKNPLTIIPERGVVYGDISFNAPEMAFSVGLDCFYADSETFDKAAHFARFIPSIHKTDVREPNPTIETAFHYHLAQLHININQA